MKIFHLITGLKIGGAESALYNFLAYVVKHQQSTHCVAYFHHGPNVDKIKALGIQTYQVAGALHHYDLVALLRLKSFIKKFKPDLIHTALWSSNIIGRLIGWHLGIPVVCDQHGNVKDEGRVRNFFDRWTIALPQKIVAVSDVVRDVYDHTIVGVIKDRRYAGAVRSKLVVIKNGIDVERVRENALSSPLRRCDVGLQEHDFVIGAVGRFEPIKSYDVLIRAFKKFIDKIHWSFMSFDTIALQSLRMNGVKETVRGECPRLAEGVSNHTNDMGYHAPKLCLVGDGSERQKLEALADQLNVRQHIVFAGFRNDVCRFYPLFDCLAFSSQSEGLSISLLEGLAFGLPIVTTHNAKTHDVLVDGTNGFLVPVNDVQAFAGALKRLYVDVHLAVRMRDENRRLSASFSIKTVVHKYFQVYGDVIRKNFF